MRIAEIEVIPIRAPRKEIVRAGTGANPITHSEFGIIRILTDDGFEGIGEISITSPRIGFSLCHASRTLVAPAVMGSDPLQLSIVMGMVESSLGGELSASYIRAAFEMALLDILGKSLNSPIYQLLGGMVRPSVPLAWGIYQKSPPQMADDARNAVASGFKAIKLKVGRSLEADLDAVQAVGKAVGGAFPLRLDANMAWRTIPEALSAIAALSGCANLSWVEQPLGMANLDGLRLLRQRCDVPIMADESVQSLRDAYVVARGEAADIFNVYVSEAGGVLSAKQIIDFAGTLDIPCILGSQAELGIGTAAAAHLGVSVSNLPYPCETFGTLRYEHDIVTETPRIEQGFLFPPTGPGLGVSLNWDIVNRWRVDV